MSPSLVGRMGFERKLWRLASSVSSREGLHCAVTSVRLWWGRAWGGSSGSCCFPSCDSASSEEFVSGGGSAPHLAGMAQKASTDVFLFPESSVCRNHHDTRSRNTLEPRRELHCLTGDAQSALFNTQGARLYRVWTKNPLLRSARYAVLHHRFEGFSSTPSSPLLSSHLTSRLNQ